LIHLECIENLRKVQGKFKIIVNFLIKFLFLFCKEKNANG
jgi:hypothetical protein